nr:MAG TPA: hypothetical protein [Caudoviricetes sp.]
MPSLAAGVFCLGWMIGQHIQRCRIYTQHRRANTPNITQLVTTI